MTDNDRRKLYNDLYNKRFDFIAIVQFSILHEMEFRRRDLAYATRASYCIPEDMSGATAAIEFLRYIDHYSIDDESTPRWMRTHIVDSIAPE